MTHTTYVRELSPSIVGWLISSHIVGFIASIILFVLTIYKFYCSNIFGSSNTKNYIRIISVANIICYILFYCSNILSDYVYCKFLQSDSKHNNTIDIIYYICIILAIISATSAPLLFFILMIIRLKNTFQDTIYQTNMYIYRVYFCGNILMAFVWCWAWLSDITPILNYDYDLLDLSNTAWFVSQYAIGLILVAMNLIYGTSLTYLFVSKLFNLIVAQQQSIDFTFIPMDFNKTKNSNHSLDITNKTLSFPHTIKDIDAEFNPKQLRLLRTITKHTILACTAITFYQLALVFGVIQKMFKGDHWDRICAYYLYTVATIIEILCIFLSFKVNHSYYLFICKSCHMCTEKCCHRLAHRSIEKESVQSMKYLKMNVYNDENQMIEN
eukprot:528778_1